MKISRKRLNESYKLSFYCKQEGPNQGDLDHEEFFDTRLEAIDRYEEVFDRNAYSLNPTMWIGDGNSWKRLNEPVIEANESLKEDFEDYEDRLFYRKSDRLENSVEKRFPGWKIFVEGSWQCGIGSDFIYIYPPDDIKLEDDPLSIYLDGSFLDISNREILKLIAQEIKPVIQANESLNEDVTDIPSSTMFKMDPDKFAQFCRQEGWLQNMSRDEWQYLQYDIAHDGRKLFVLANDIKACETHRNLSTQEIAETLFDMMQDENEDLAESLDDQPTDFIIWYTLDGEENYIIISALNEDDAVDKFSINLDPSLITDVHEVVDYGYHAESLEEDKKITRYSDVLPQKDRDRGWWYFTTHGVGPGTIPKDLNVLEVRDGQNKKGTWGTFVRLDGIVNTSELSYYDLTELAPPNAKNESLKESNDSWEEYYDSDLQQRFYFINAPGGKGEITYLDNDGDGYYKCSVWLNRRTHKYRTFNVTTSLKDAKEKVEALINKYSDSVKNESLKEDFVPKYFYRVMKYLYNNDYEGCDEIELEELLMNSPQFHNMSEKTAEAYVEEYLTYYRDPKEFRKLKVDESLKEDDAVDDDNFLTEGFLHIVKE